MSTAYKTMIDFNLWQDYSRKEIADVLGIQSTAMARGVFTPKGRDLIFLFVTRENQRSQIRYQNRVIDDVLVWEGERKHGNDRRIVEAAIKNDEILLFFRSRNHQRFVYFGQIHLFRHKLRNDRPSQFMFRIESIKSENHQAPVTQRTVTREERVGQKKFRDGVLDLWSNSCAVTSLRHPNLLRASHIQPWRHCGNEDRLNKFNGLALTPNLDSLFDIGFVSFKDSDGSIRLTDALDEPEWRILNVKPEMSLRAVFVQSKEYLDYHNECVFEAWKKKEFDMP